MATTSKSGMRAVRWSLAAAALLSTGCEIFASTDRSKIPDEGGTGGTGGMTMTGGTTGGTTSTECAVAGDCPDPGNECLVRACTDSTCAPEPVASGTAIAEQTAGDCQVTVCDGAGSTTSDDDDTDAPTDGNECTSDVCTAGVPSNPAVMAGTACGAGGALYCSAAGKCVGCINDLQCGTADDCAYPTCKSGTCETLFTAPGTPVTAQIAGDCLQVRCNGIGGTKVEDDDTDIEDDGNQCTQDECNAGAATHPNSPSGAACDDGGIKCNGAGDCVECLTGGDCAEGVCSAQVCAAADCMDGVENGDETDLDCGGTCPGCGTGKSCLIGDDCTSLVCTSDVCKAPTCLDVTKNGNETDVDCGGSCPKCGPGLACMVNADCAGGTCTGNTCVPTCTDQVENGAETDVDCGGGTCLDCGPGKACSVNGDCVGSSCVGDVCVPTCTDQVKNGAETDVDCGGGTCPVCPDGKACMVDDDCNGGVCEGNVCGAAICPNGIVEGAEGCDDNNAANGDGCTSSCVCEATQVVTVDPVDVAIPDDGYVGTVASMACIDVPLTAQCNITSMTVTIGMSHTWIGDLTIKLVHPDNTVITLVSRPGELEVADDGSDGVTGGDSSNLVKTHPITFQMGAAVSAENMGNTLFNAGNVCENDMICTFAPNSGAAAAGTLATLAGKKANGTWKLCVGDAVGADTGEIDKVTLSVNQ